MPANELEPQRRWLPPGMLPIEELLAYLLAYVRTYLLTYVLTYVRTYPLTCSQ